MSATTRTLNPLHLEDLDPHRFEDLIRQLAYDFRTWRSLEALGRSGSDEGMDIRGWEVVAAADTGDEAGNDGGRENGDGDGAVDRLWVIQCKRETSIGPSKVGSILEDFFKGEAMPYGYILASSCNFSKATRDTAAAVLRAEGVQEFYLWGKAEVEDQLVQPKNDNLLFAYFGISLQTRRRSMRTEVRSKLTLKRKLTKDLGDLRETTPFRTVLIRDPREASYPFVKSTRDFLKKPLWQYWFFHGHEPPDHVALVTRKFFAYVNWETEEWDFTKESNEAMPHHPSLFGLDRSATDPEDKSGRCRAYWELHVPEGQRAWAIELGFIEYDRILACDELGDRYNEGPHLLVEYVDGQPFKWFSRSIESADPHSSRFLGSPDERRRIQFFPKEIPDEREQWHEHLLKRINEGQEEG